MHLQEGGSALGEGEGERYRGVHPQHMYARQALMHLQILCQLCSWLEALQAYSPHGGRVQHWGDLPGWGHEGTRRMGKRHGLLHTMARLLTGVGALDGMMIILWLGQSLTLSACASGPPWRTVHPCPWRTMTPSSLVYHNPLVPGVPCPPCPWRTVTPCVPGVP